MQASKTSRIDLNRSSQRALDAELGEISRRTGIPKDQLSEAVGNLRKYRFSSGLLQYRVFLKNTGTHEWMTVIPDGDWRAITHGAETRKLSLRRYIILLYHCTPMGPHRSRDRTMQAILDAGLWWPKLYSDVQGFVKGCQICADAKSLPLVTGHQRSREYDGPFRYLMMDFVGPVTPETARGTRHGDARCTDGGAQQPSDFPASWPWEKGRSSRSSREPSRTTCGSATSSPMVQEFR